MQHYHQEIVTIVDKDNNITGEALRQEMSSKRLIHRSTYILIVDSKTKNFYVQKRASVKRYCPSHWDVFFGGVVQKGESYEENAQRELKEETGLHSDKIIFLFDFYFESDRTKSWGRVFYIFYDGKLDDLKPAQDESEFIALLSYREIIEKIQNDEKFTPDGLVALDKIINDGLYEIICK